MPGHVVLLRGINVGGVRLAMSDLRAFAEDLGLANPRTYIASGNLLVEGWKASADELEVLLESKAGDRLGLSTSFFARAAKDWSQIIARNPFGAEVVARPANVVVMLLKTPLSAADEKTLRAAVTGPERFRAVGRTLYVDFPNGQGRSTLDRDWSRTGRAPLSTARNWNTVLKLAELVAE
ncbi:MAG: DUF1697 domain-containing protein [Hyphomonadaceae bacterium]